MISIADVVAAVTPLLAPWGPTSYGAQSVAREAGPRRWVWVPVSEAFTAAEFRNGDLAKRVASVQIHSWGLTEAECEAMQAAVVSAIRQVLGGKRYSLSSAQWTERKDAHRGAALLTTLSIDLPMPRIALPLTTSIEAATLQTVEIEAAPITPEVGS